MILKIFSIHDNKAQAFRTPFYLHQEGEAIRAFQDMANDLKHPVGQHPEDYTLFVLGHWNDTNAHTETFDTPKSLGLALEHRTQFQLDLEDIPEIPNLLKEQTS